MKSVCNLYKVSCWPYGYGVDDVYVWAHDAEEALEFALDEVGCERDFTIQVVPLKLGVVSRSNYVE